MRLRHFVERAVLIVVAVLVWRCWCLVGMIVPNRVDSGSMAPTLLGIHRHVECGDCGYGFPCEIEPFPAAARVACPNCGYQENSVDGTEKGNLPGDGLLVDRSVYSWRTPQRWEVVSFRLPARADQICVKRVVGLPGEKVMIRQGDVYVGGEMQRKTLDQQRAVAILVHDANYQPTLFPTPPARWSGENASSRWGSAGGRFAHAPGPEQGVFDWLVYRHWRRVPNQPGKVELVPVDDTCGYSQKHPRRVEEVSPVRDLLVSFDLVRTWDDGELAVRMTDGNTEFEFRVSPATGQYQARIGGRILPDGVGRLPGPIGRTHVELSTIDRQYLVAMDRTVIGTWTHPPVKPFRSSTIEPVRIGASRLGVVIENLRLFRDVYYAQPTGFHARWGVARPIQLAEDEFFVLGDNSPVSEDSRVWAEGPGVPATLLTGRPLLVHLPMRQIRLGPLEFQVPDPGRMRYIP